jgi:hypothetical protein
MLLFPGLKPTCIWWDPRHRFCTSSGSLAIFAAIRRASSLLSSLAAERHRFTGRDGLDLLRPKECTSSNDWTFLSSVRYNSRNPDNKPT